jgi:7-cyano-7-deazaguanine synthase in queuosine biosynthesis
MSERRSGGMDSGTFVILVLALIVLLGHMSLTYQQLRDEHEQLSRQHAAQASQIQTAQQSRRQLEGIAGSVAQLAEDGNANAILVRDQLQAQGIQIRPTGR